MSPSVFTTLYEEYGELVETICGRVAGKNGSDAEQEVWTRVHEDLTAGDIPDMSDSAASKLWIQTRAQRTARDIARRERRQDSRFLPLEAAAPGWTSDSDEPAEQFIQAPGSTGDRGPAHEALQAAIDRLPPTYRDLFYLVVYAGEPLQSAAEQLTLTYSAAHKRYQRGTEILRDLLFQKAA